MTDFAELQVLLTNLDLNKHFNVCKIDLVSRSTTLLSVVVPIHPLDMNLFSIFSLQSNFFTYVVLVFFQSFYLLEV